VFGVNDNSISCSLIFPHSTYGAELHQECSCCCIPKCLFSFMEVIVVLQFDSPKSKHVQSLTVR
jgi:hypothetical protein